MNSWWMLLGLALAWGFGWGARDVSFDPQKQLLKSKHEAEVKELKAEIDRARAQVAMLIGTDKPTQAPSTCCGDATHGCMGWPPDDPTARMHG